MSDLHHISIVPKHVLYYAGIRISVKIFTSTMSTSQMITLATSISTRTASTLTGKATTGTHAAYTRCLPRIASVAHDLAILLSLRARYLPHSSAALHLLVLQCDFRNSADAHANQRAASQQSNRSGVTALYCIAVATLKQTAARTC